MKPTDATPIHKCSQLNVIVGILFGRNFHFMKIDVGSINPKAVATFSY